MVLKEKLFIILVRKQVWVDCIRLHLVLSNILEFAIEVSYSLISFKLALA